MKTIPCSECLHWGQPSHDTPIHHRCDHPKCNAYHEKPDGFGVQDGEPGERGAFCTGPNFSCIHAEPIP